MGFYDNETPCTTGRYVCELYDFNEDTEDATAMADVVIVSSESISGGVEGGGTEATGTAAGGAEAGATEAGGATAGGGTSKKKEGMRGKDKGKKKGKKDKKGKGGGGGSNTMENEVVVTGGSGGVSIKNVEFTKKKKGSTGRIRWVLLLMLMILTPSSSASSHCLSV